ncbi:hypothetical protein IQ07DRAFT_505432 [Pyrenochaeta sp. DS3sAY3a]|nr:hypothetical protein IQ07DRAFT_505432 [Pyrenochaeta sp. DS3sAY3a]
MASVPSARPHRRLIGFCDGTWVGRETSVSNRSSNIQLLAKMVGDIQFVGDATENPSKVHPISPHNTSTSKGKPNVVAGYQEGVGLNGTFLEYIWDGATASSIGEDCINVYKFIVDNYTDEHEIFLFGFSRGAFTIRSVAGMINNCGIIKRPSDFTDDNVSSLCYNIYRTYRSELNMDRPKSEEWTPLSRDEKKIWNVPAPIRFMGCIDTVGALGIPRINAGVGIEWKTIEFFDQRVSSVVQVVWHAVALHDRFWFFGPCLILNGDTEGDPTVKQRWFPGTHYDLGRQTFRFMRQHPANWIEGVLGLIPDLLSETIYPNQVLGDCVLRWIVQGIAEVDDNSPTPIIPKLTDEIETLERRLASPPPYTTGSGDIYGDVLFHAPLGTLLDAIHSTSESITSLLNRVLPRLGDNIQDVLGVKTIIGILTATADRRIPGVAADVYPYKEPERVTIQGREVEFTVEKQARMRERNERGSERYPSQTPESFELWKRVFGPGAGSGV